MLRSSVEKPQPQWGIVENTEIGSFRFERSVLRKDLTDFVDSHWLPNDRTACRIFIYEIHNGQKVLSFERPDASEQRFYARDELSKKLKEIFRERLLGWSLETSPLGFVRT